MSDREGLACCYTQGDSLMLLFLHGLESSDQGTKARFIHRLFPEMLIPRFQGDLDDRMRQLNGLKGTLEKMTIIGSSYGGLMATIFALANNSRVTRLILLAPALNFPEGKSYLSGTTDAECLLVVGSSDTVTPGSQTIPLARKFLKNPVCMEVEDDHSLGGTYAGMPWTDLLDPQQKLATVAAAKYYNLFEK